MYFNLHIFSPVGELGHNTCLSSLHWKLCNFLNPFERAETFSQGYGHTSLPQQQFIPPGAICSCLPQESLPLCCMKPVCVYVLQTKPVKLSGVIKASYGKISLKTRMTLQFWFRASQKPVSGGASGL